jgi:hypothetical protein
MKNTLFTCAAVLALATPVLAQTITPIADV